jgi:hypothetical protein
MKNKNNIYKKVKSYILIGLVAVALAFCTPACVQADTPTTMPAQSVEKVNDFGGIPVKQPFGKKELAMKFVLAMLGVATSSVVIYVLLSLYNKIFHGGGKTSVMSEVDNDFKTPNNMKDAINIFLKKTK